MAGCCFQVVRQSTTTQTGASERSVDGPQPGGVGGAWRPPKGQVHILTPITFETDLIWKTVLVDAIKLRNLR